MCRWRFFFFFFLGAGVMYFSGTPRPGAEGMDLAVVLFAVRVSVAGWERG